MFLTKFEVVIIRVLTVLIVICAAIGGIIGAFAPCYVFFLLLTRQANPAHWPLSALVFSVLFSGLILAYLGKWFAKKYL